MAGVRGVAGPRLFTGALAFASMAFLLVAVPILAQETKPERTWQPALWVKGGYQYPSGKFARNTATDINTGGILETVAELSPSPVVGGGLEVRLPRHDLAARLGWETTIDAQATGQIAACALLDGRLCKTETAQIRILGAGFDLRVLRGEPTARVRPVISGGVALRWYDITVSECTASESDARRVCRAVVDLYRDPGLHTVIRGGAGATFRLDHLATALVFSAGAGRYSGGTERVSGRWYMDFRAELSAGVAVF